ncbi:MAG TPA: group 1 truncated hemoglobin [Kofleriaceae bacterium]|jgi:hemoglobin
MSALFDKIGDAKLHAVVDDFYTRLFRDVMIGFMFAGKDRAQLAQREYEFTAGFLGADVKYSGRPIRTAHGHLTIFGGQFERRLQILRETMRDHGVDPEVQQAWIDHTLALRPQVTRDRGSECEATAETAPKLGLAPPAPDPERPIKLGRK